MRYVLVQPTLLATQLTLPPYSQPIGHRQPTTSLETLNYDHIGYILSNQLDPFQYSDLSCSISTFAYSDSVAKNSSGITAGTEEVTKSDVFRVTIISKPATFAAALVTASSKSAISCHAFKLSISSDQDGRTTRIL